MRRLGVRMWHKACDAAAPPSPTPPAEMKVKRPKRNVSAPNAPTRGALGAGPY